MQAWARDARSEAGFWSLLMVTQSQSRGQFCREWAVSSPVRVETLINSYIYICKSEIQIQIQTQIYLFQGYFDELNKPDKGTPVTAERYRQILNPWLRGVMTKNTSAGLTMSLCHAYRTSLPQVIQEDQNIIKNTLVSLFNVSRKDRAALLLITTLSLIGCNLGRPVGDSEPETYIHHNSSFTITDDFIKFNQAPIIPTQHIHR